MPIKLIFALIASILAIIGNLPYLRDAIQRKIRPHPYTWLVWSIVSCVTFFGQLQKGGGYAVVATGIAEIFTALIFVVSLRNGFKDIRRIDTVFLITALAGLLPWYLTKDPTTSVIVVVCIDLVAFLPTFRKGYERPETENLILYIMNVARHLLILIAIDHFNIATALHSISMICTNTIMTLILYRQRTNQTISKTKSNHQHLPNSK